LASHICDLPATLAAFQKQLKTYLLLALQALMTLFYSTDCFLIALLEIIDWFLNALLETVF